MVTVHAMPAHAAASENYRIDPCPTPLQVSLHGLPASPRAFDAWSTCGNEQDRGLADIDITTFVGDQAQLDALQAQGPSTSTTLDEQGFDLRLTLHDGTLQRHYAADHLPLDAQHHALERIGHQGGPALAVSLARLPDPHVGLQVVDAPLQQLARDLARLKSLPIRNLERIDAELKGTFHFSAIPVRTVLQLIGDVAEVSLTRDAQGAWVFGAVKDFRAIQEQTQLAFTLYDDPVRQRAVLERIVELSQPDDASDAPFDASYWIQQLVVLAERDQDFDRAETWQRRLLLEIEREQGSDNIDYARAQVDLGMLRLQRDDVVEASVGLERAFALFARHEPQALQHADAQVVASYLRLLRGLVAVRVDHGEIAAAIEPWRRVAEYRVQRLGARHPLAIEAWSDLALLQRCAGQDADARATDRLAARATQGDKVPETPDDIDVELLGEFERSLRYLLLARFEAKWKAARAAPQSDRIEHATAQERMAELTATLGLTLPAALEYESALSTRVTAQGRDHPATRRTAERAIELFELSGQDGAERIRQMLEPR